MDFTHLPTKTAGATVQWPKGGDYVEYLSIVGGTNYPLLVTTFPGGETCYLRCGKAFKPGATTKSWTFAKADGTNFGATDLVYLNIGYGVLLPEDTIGNGGGIPTPPSLQLSQGIPISYLTNGYTSGLIPVLDYRYLILNLAYTGTAGNGQPIKINIRMLDDENQPMSGPPTDQHIPIYYMDGSPVPYVYDPTGPGIFGDYTINPAFVNGQPQTVIIPVMGASEIILGNVVSTPGSSLQISGQFTQNWN